MVNQDRQCAVIINSYKYVYVCVCIYVWLHVCMYVSLGEYAQSGNVAQVLVDHVVVLLQV